MSPRCLAFLVLLPLLRPPLPAAAPPGAAALAGTWDLVPARSTEASPWQSIRLVIAIAGDAVTIERDLAAGRRTDADVIHLDLRKAENLVPIDWWADNRHIGAYIGADHTRHIRTQWLEDGRLLRLSTDLVLETQQGSHAVNILSDYKVSVSGAHLTLTELRSTRDRPVVYNFVRAKPSVPSP